LLARAFAAAASVYIAWRSKEVANRRIREAVTFTVSTQRYTPSALASCLHDERRHLEGVQRALTGPVDFAESTQLHTHWRIEMKDQHVPKVFALGVALALLIPTPRAFGQRGQERVERPERVERVEKVERVERPDRVERVEKVE